MATKKLQYIAKEVMECGEGWLEPVQSIVDFINWHNSCSDNQVRIAQIKNKFGHLEVYTDGSCQGLGEAKKFAQELATNTCEICGKKEHVGMRNDSWYVTLCRDCVQKEANRLGRPLKWRENGSDENKTINPVNEV